MAQDKRTCSGQHGVDTLDFRQPRQAVILLGDGRWYEGHAVIRAGWVHADMQRRTALGCGQVHYNPAGVRSWPRGKVHEIR